VPENTTRFIPAKESRWFIAIFDFYVRNLFWRRFKNILIDQQYQPTKESRTIYFLNHTSWWDGLIPLLLNQKLFQQNARAMMEDRQMRDHPFFSKIGAFSVNLENPRSAVQSLRYAVESMKRPNSCLFIFPEGKIVPFSTNRPNFKKGLGWLSKQCPDADIVPVGIYIQTARHDKPELYIRVGAPVQTDHTLSSESLNEIFEIQMGTFLNALQNDSHHNLQLFNPV
jgi:chlorobactene lauroyltransferase